MTTNSFQWQLAAVLAAVLADDDGCCEWAGDDLLAMATALAPLLEDAAEYYLRHGRWPEICDPA